MRLLASLYPMLWRWWNKGRHLNPNSTAVAGLSCRKTMVSIRWAISVHFFGINELRNKLSHLVGPICLSLAYKGSFSLTYLVLQLHQIL